ncbi:MAG: PD-(D/E)XK nuclease family protein [Bacteroidota bacterium]
MDELNTLLKLDIPVSKNHTGFLELIKKQYHENINSNIYAHFLNSSQSEVSSLFLNALLDLIEIKSPKKIQIHQAYAHTEVPTSKGRLDILIDGSFGSGKILIENKLYHWLHNDLDEYWNHFNCSEDKKVGVLLTLEKHFIPENVTDKFINITHLEWINKVKENFILDTFPLNYQVYIGDFIQTIENLSKSYDMNATTKFYFEHTNQILKATATVSEAHQFLNNQLEYIANEIGWKTYGSSMNWRNFWDEHNHIDTYLTIITENLLNGKMIFSLILELKREDKKKVDEVRNLLKDHEQYRADSQTYSRGDYLHFQIKDYPISMNDLEHFGKFVVQKIHEDFADMTLMVIESLYPGRSDNFTWRDSFIGVNQ